MPSTIRALVWVDYLEAHAVRRYGATTTASLRAARPILDRIRAGDLAEGFTARDVYRRQWADLAEREAVLAALSILVAHGYLTESNLPTMAAGGRPTVAYLIHPSVRP